ncbi:unnamed protein product [Polarella glacialis]|uniref:Uncharacterized protein n=1 Tax=Polarella glacialis TaxID=89957 RepID=A0A813FF82_POLGL|nr:unnamed protein product [Polarella glacialis]
MGKTPSSLARRQGSWLAALAAALSLALACFHLHQAWRPLAVAFASVPSPLSSRQVARPKNAAVTMRAALKPGDAVMVIGMNSPGWPTSKIAASMLNSLGYRARPVVSKATDQWAAFADSGIKGYVFGSSEPLPACSGLVLANEIGCPADKLVACVRGLAALGQLSRVALLSRPCVSGQAEVEAEVVEACERAGAEWTIVQTGNLRGGGPASRSKHSCGQEIYDAVQERGVLGPTAGIEEELFDLKQRGLRVGAVAGFGLGPFSFQVPATSRILAASALVESLSLPEAANQIIGTASSEAEEEPSSADWHAAFRALKES